MAPRPCLGCGHLIPRGSRCMSCTLRRNRASTTERGYGSRWQKLSAEQIKRQPWCSRCGTPGDAANPLTADHIVPKDAGGAPYDPANLTTLCRRCNSRKGTRVPGVG